MGVLFRSVYNGLTLWLFLGRIRYTALASHRMLLCIVTRRHINDFRQQELFFVKRFANNDSLQVGVALGHLLETVYVCLSRDTPRGDDVCWYGLEE